MKWRNNLKFKKKYHWLVTGSAGFIGSNIVNFLLNKNQNVIGIDNLLNGKYKNILHVKKNNKKKNYKFIKKDILNINFNDKIYNKVDFIIHMAAAGSVPRSYSEPEISVKNNINISIKVLDSFKKHKNLKRIFIASSSSVYGDKLSKFKHEKMLLTPKSPYAVSKLAVEKYSEIFSNMFSLKITILRLFNVFGPYQRIDSDYSAVIPKWIKNILSKKIVTINGSKKISRDFTYIDNILFSILLLVQNEKKLKKFDIFNVACGKSITLAAVIKCLKKNMSQYKLINHTPIEKILKKRSGDIFQSRAGIAKIKKAIKFKPVVSFNDGIEMTIDWFIKNKNYFYKKHFSKNII